jgi:RNA polymerase sigma-70 factor, ECF subfamily
MLFRLFEGRAAMTSETSPDPASLELYREYLTFLARLHLHPRLQTKMGASDIVQQTILKAARNLTQYRGRSEAELAGWLRRILAHTLVDGVREFGVAKRDVALEHSLETSFAESSARLEALLQASPTSPSDQMVRHEQLMQLSAALAQLPNEQRLALEMHYLQGCTIVEVAAQMARTERSVAGLVRRGLQKLRELLIDERD